MTGTSSRGTSTPRSPRATITASTSGRMPLQVRHDLRALQLGDDRNVGALVVEELPHFLDVGGGADEGDRHVVHRLLDAEAQILPVLLGQARHRHRQPRERHPLVIATPRRPTTTRHSHLAVLHLLHDELDHPVVHPDRIAGPQRREELGMVQRAARGGALHGRGRSARSARPASSMACPPTKVPSRTLGPWRSWRMVIGRPHRPPPPGSRGSPRRARRGCRARS